VAAESKIDPMHQFQISPLAGNLDGTPFVFTNSALWMLVVLALIWIFMLGGMKRELVPGRWQVMVEGVTGFIHSMVTTNIGPEGRKYMPWVFTVFMFILFANLLGMMPFALAGAHPFTVTSQFTVTGVMAIISFGIVLVVGFGSTASTSSRCSSRTGRRRFCCRSSSLSSCSPSWSARSASRSVFSSQ
jgi:F-type H+-transporting ATPase subunit a